MTRLAIIGGTGVYSLPGKVRRRVVTTVCGEVAVDLLADGDDREIVFLARHGKQHKQPPHAINYRANMLALKELGVRQVFATTAVGSCNKDYRPGDLVLLSDVIDFTRNRPLTIFDHDDGEVRHVDLTEPYCPSLRRLLARAAGREGLALRQEAVYVCTEGPRFETAAEIRMFRRLGGDVLGMTNVPEVVFARELGMCYAVLGMVSNWCAGMGGDAHPVFHDFGQQVDDGRQAIFRIFMRALGEPTEREPCRCNLPPLVL